MNNKQFFLKKNSSKKSTNESSFLSIDIKSNKKLLPSTSIEDTVNQYDLYNEERQASNLFRLTFTINPLCSNVLHNKVSEIIYNEGSDNAKCANFEGTNWKCIRQNNDSVLQSTVYHCGLDILNNHFLRSNTFKCVELNGVNMNNDYFNTMFDYVRNYKGEKKKFYKDIGWSVDPNLSNEYLHLYIKDDIKSFKDTFLDSVKESNGWYGFINTVRMGGYKENDVLFNKAILNRKACEFIDFYPERDLFYFTPKYNKYRHREEKNWNYCLTYPYSSTTEVDFIEEDIEYLNEKISTIKILKCNFNNYNSKGLLCIRILSTCKHGLKEKDMITLFNEKEMKLDNLIVEEIENEYNFFVKQDEDLNDLNVNEFSFCKMENGEPCHYYVRLFKRIPNWKFANEEITEYNLYGNGTNNLIDVYNSLSYDFENHNNKIAFAKNIYGDDISEIVYTDDIDLSYLKDNLGRPLSEIYLTILKNNKGYKDFYRDASVSNKNVEYSHCFGPLLQAFKLSPMISNSFNSLISCCLKDESIYNKGLDYKTLLNDLDRLCGSEILYEKDKVFYGDVVCFSPSNFNEEVLEESYFRFNTVQRELDSPIYNGWSAKTKLSSVSFKYKDGINVQVTDQNGEHPNSSNTFGTIYYDDIDTDDYDVNSFKGKGTVITGYSNNQYEGNVYKSHYRIPLHSFSENLNVQQPKYYYPLTIKNIDGVNNQYFVKTSNLSYLEKNDKIKGYNKKNNEYYDLIVEKVQGRYSFLVYCEDNIVDKINPKDIILFKPDGTVPNYAYLMKNGTFNYVWRDLIKNGFDNNTSLETYPFTNGAYYINTQINFYLERQDKEGVTSLSSTFEYGDVAPNRPTKEENNYYNEEDITC